MLKVDDKLISDDIIEEEFICNLSACKGACCVKGDGGAPITEEEGELLAKHYNSYKQFLTTEGIETLAKKGLTDTQDGKLIAPLIDDGNTKPCAFVCYENGIALCGVEKAFRLGKTDWKKPISCDLYPIRVSKVGEFEALNYSRWSICKPACDKGKSAGVPIYKFLKEPLIRAYGEEFYNQLDATAEYVKSKK